MSSGKKKGKGKTLSLTEFLGNESAPNYVKSSSTSWADEMEEEDTEQDASFTSSLINRSALPTAPRAARGANVDMDKVPTAPPFTAFLGNLPFEVSVEDIERFFQKLEVTNVRLIEEGGRAKGYGYAEFADRHSLVEALSMDETTMRGRPIRVNLAEGKQGEREDRGGRNKYDDFDDRTGDDWRRKPAGGQQDDFDDRRGSRDGRFGDRDGGRYGDRDRGRYGDRDGGRYGDRDRYSSGRSDEMDSGGSWRRSGGSQARYGHSYGGGGYGDNRQYGRRDRNDSYGGSRDRDGGGRSFGSGYRDERRRYSPPRDRRDDGYGRRDRDGYEKRDDNSYQDDIPRERPKLQLQKRTKPVEDQSQEVTSRASSIFGNAKPVDTLSKELEIEEKIKSKQHEPESTAQESRNASIFGSAKPVDTAAREREIEARLQDRSKAGVSDHRLDRDGRRYDEQSRPRRDSTSPEHRGDRVVLSPGSKGSSRAKRSSAPEDEDEETHATPASPTSPTASKVASPQAPKTPTSPPTHTDEPKLVPAPLPKENAWAKRKEQQNTPVSPPVAGSMSPATPASPPQSEVKKENHKENATVTKPVTDSPPTEAVKENTAPGGPPSKTEFIPAKAPVENAWAKRAQQKTEQISKTEESKSEQSHSDEMLRGRGESRDAGRGETRDAGRPNAWSRGAPRGRGGPPRGRGAGRGGDTSRKQPEEKPLPKSIDEMPKYEETKGKDLSDTNKFSLLLDDDGASDGD